MDEGSQLGRYTAYPLLVLGDDITTDHISPASAIPRDSLVADYLVARGESLRQYGELFDTISISAGVRGTQILIAPSDYLNVVKGKVGAISRDK